MSMMKSSFRRREPLLRRGLRPWAIGILFLILLLVLARFAFPGALIALSTPAWNAGAAASDGVGGFFAAFKESAELSRALDAAERENAALQNENIALAAKLADALALGGAESGIVAGVIAGPPLSSYDTLVIGAGNAAGIREGMRASAAGGVPVGYVAETTAATARVILYSSPGEETHGWAGESRIALTLIGAGAGAFRATVPSAEAVLEGDIVYIGGPGPLPIGRIVSVSRDPSSPEATLRIRPLVNPFSISSVLVSP